MLFKLKHAWLGLSCPMGPEARGAAVGGRAGTWQRSPAAVPGRAAALRHSALLHCTPQHRCWGLILPGFSASMCHPGCSAQPCSPKMRAGPKFLVPCLSGTKRPSAASSLGCGAGTSSGPLVLKSTWICASGTARR